MLANYERTLLVLTPVMPKDEMRQSADEFGRLFGLRVQERQGTLEILNRAWQSAKIFLKNKPAPPGKISGGYGS
jgi:hypothetical protein